MVTMRRVLVVVPACAMVVVACGTFGEDAPTPDPGAVEAGALDGATSSDAAAGADGSSGGDGAASCTPAASWSLDFSGALPAEYSVANNTVTANVASGKFTAGVVIEPAGGQYRGRFARELAVPSGVDSLELAFTVFAGATPAQTNFEVGCSLYLRPTPENPANDRRFVVRTNTADMSFNWNGEAPKVLGPANLSSKRFELTLQAAPDGTSFTGSLSYEGVAHGADLDLGGAIAKGIRLECGLVFGAAAAVDAGAAVRGYTVSVDDVSLSVCARP